MLIEKCPQCGESLAAATMGSTIVSCGRCSGAFITARLISEATSTSAAPAELPESGLVLPPHFRQRYDIGQPLGRGTMGLVLRGTDLRDGREVAIKILLSGADANVLARFLREAELLASVEHPHLVEILDLDQINGHPCLITELLSGGTLRDRMTGRMPMAETVRIASECLSALDACHAAGIIHRDLKPENILFDATGNAKVADLGIAKAYGEGDKLTRTGAFIGTPRYMSPEQVCGLAADAASDVYAMGVIVYEMIAGVRPAVGNNLRDLLQQILKEPPPPLTNWAPDVRPALQLAIEQALAKKPADRYASAAAFALALRRGLDPTSGPMRARTSDSGQITARRAAIKESAQRAMASMEIADGSASRIGATSAQILAVIAAPLDASDGAPGVGISPALGASMDGLKSSQTELLDGRPERGTGTDTGHVVARSDPPPPERGRTGRVAVPKPGNIPARPVTRGNSARRAIAAGAGLLAVAAVALGARALMGPAAGDPKTLIVQPGITGVLCSWTSRDAYVAEGRAESAGNPTGAMRDEHSTREHRVLITGLKEGAHYQVALSAAGRAMFPPVDVQLGRALELPSTVATEALGPDLLEATLDVPVPVSVVSATSAEPGLSIEATPGVTTPLKLTLRGPGAAVGLTEVQLRVATVDGVTAERTLRVPGSAERIREYAGSSRFVHDLETIDREIVSRRVPVEEREHRAERLMKTMPGLARLGDDLPAIEHTFGSPAISLARRMRLHEIVGELQIAEGLLRARTGTKQVGLTLPADAALRRLSDLRKLAAELIPCGEQTPVLAPGPQSLQIYQSEWGKGGLVARGPGMDDARAGTELVAGKMLDVRDVLVFRAQRRRLKADARAVRLTLLGRCLESHLFLSVWINRTWRVRFFGTSAGKNLGENSATAFLAGDSETEARVPRQQLWADLPAGLLLDGENTFEVTCHTLVKEMGTNTVFCVPSLHEARWEVAP